LGIDNYGEPTLRSSVTFADAETRGRLRAWKKKLALDYASFGRALDEVPRLLALSNMGAGRCERALAEIQRAVGSGPVLEHTRLDNEHPYTVWSILKPRAAVVDDILGPISRLQVKAPAPALINTPRSGWVNSGRDAKPQQNAAQQVE
jgi:hypothetical protein